MNVLEISITTSIIPGSLIIAILMALMMSPALSSATSIPQLNQTQTELGSQLVIEAEKDLMLIVSILASELETRIIKSAAIIEITSKLPEVSSAPFASSITRELHGIPQDADTQKRKVAQDILAADRDFELILFLMPNGDVYLEEPYSRQQNLTEPNLASREYFRGAIDTQNTYLGNVYISASSGRPQANIAVPIYSENNGTLVGVWAGGLNLTSLSSSLQSLNLTDINERIVYVDQQGQKVADSDNQLLSRSSNMIESFAHLQSFRNAINGQSGTITEIINGTQMAVSYHPLKAFSKTWAVLFMQSHEGNRVS
ncbi:MAG: hypothetical protein M3275_16035 [Thermoproteota archaeon]|nr:hypothetical protein [Thermoproteota archaeon]